MNQKFQAAVHQRDGFAYTKLGGVIDEDNELTDLTERIPSGTVVIDLGEIERINSCGVRDWVNWLTRIEKQGAKVVMVECSPAIVAQINLVNNFTGNGVVKSFYAPYFCPNCDREKVLLVEASEMGPSPHKAPTCRCDECDGVMDFDDMEDSYFAFLTSTKKVADAAKLALAVAEMNPGRGNDEKSKIRSRVGTGSGGGSGSGSLSGQNASSLPSVPALPSISRAASSVSGIHAATMGSTPSPNANGQVSSRFGTVPTASGRFSAVPSSGGGSPGHARFGTGGTNTTGSGAGSRPGLTGSGTELGARAASMSEGRFQGPITQPKSGKMIYVLVFVLIAALCVLAALLISGGGKDGSNRVGALAAAQSSTAV